MPAEICPVGALFCSIPPLAHALVEMAVDVGAGFMPVENFPLPVVFSTGQLQPDPVVFVLMKQYKGEK